MMPVTSYNEYLSLMNKKSQNKNFVSCILFLNKNFETPVCEEILRDIKGFHLRSGNLMTFFLPGYDADILENSYPYIDFYDDYFNIFIRDLQNVCGWRYSGGTEMLFLNMIDGRLDFSNVYDYELDRIIGQGNLETFHDLFNRFINSLEKNKELRLGKYAATRITVETAKTVLKLVSAVFNRTLPELTNLEVLGTLLPKNYSLK